MCQGSVHMQKQIYSFTLYFSNFYQNMRRILNSWLETLKAQRSAMLLMWVTQTNSFLRMQSRGWLVLTRNKYKYVTKNIYLFPLNKQHRGATNMFNMQRKKEVQIIQQIKLKFQGINGDMFSDQTIHCPQLSPLQYLQTSMSKTCNHHLA